MSDPNLSKLLRALLDRRAEPVSTIAAAQRLAKFDSQDALDALLHVAQEQDAAEPLSRAAGESIAKILIRRGAVDQVPLHDFTEGAYLGYDETIARYLRSVPDG